MKWEKCVEARRNRLFRCMLYAPYKRYTLTQFPLQYIHFPGVVLLLLAKTVCVAIVIVVAFVYSMTIISIYVPFESHLSSLNWPYLDNECPLNSKLTHAISNFPQNSSQFRRNIDVVW